MSFCNPKLLAAAHGPDHKSGSGDLVAPSPDSVDTRPLD